MNDVRMKHLGDEAELYALGALSDRERASVDAHVATCDECARRIGEAEDVIAAMTVPAAEVSPQLDRRVRTSLHRRSSRVSMSYALAAAAFVLGLIPSALFWQQSRGLQEAEATRQAAQAAMIHSHFLHAQFKKIAPDAPAAKLIFARDGSWFYVIATTDRNYSVTADGHNLGTLSGSGNERGLFVSPAPKTKEVLLLDGTRPIARAPIAVTR